MTIDPKQSLLNLYQELEKSPLYQKVKNEGIDKVAEVVANDFFLTAEKTTEGEKFHFTAKPWIYKLFGKIRNFFMGPSAGYKFEENFKALSKQFEAIEADPISHDIVVSETQEGESLQKLQTILNALAKHVEGRGKHPKEIEKISHHILLKKPIEKQAISPTQPPTTKSVKLKVTVAPQVLLAAFKQEQLPKLNKLLDFTNVSDCFRSEVKQNLDSRYQYEPVKEEYEALLEEGKEALENSDKWDEWQKKAERFQEKLDTISDSFSLVTQFSETHIRRDRIERFQKDVAALGVKIANLRNQAFENGFLDRFDKAFSLQADVLKLSQQEERALDRAYGSEHFDDVMSELRELPEQIESTLKRAQAFNKVQNALQNVQEARSIISRDEFAHLGQKIEQEFPASKLDEPLLQLVESLQNPSQELVNESQIDALVSSAKKMILEPFENQFVIRNAELNGYRTRYMELSEELQAHRAKVPQELKDEFEPRLNALENQLEEVQSQGFEYLNENITNWAIWRDNVAKVQGAASALMSEINTLQERPKTAPAKAAPPPPPGPLIKKAKTLLEVQLETLKEDLKALPAIEEAKKLLQAVNQHLQNAPKAGTPEGERKAWDESATKLIQAFDKLAVTHLPELVAVYKKQVREYVEQLRYIPKGVLGELDTKGALKELEKQFVRHFKQADQVKVGDLKSWQAQQKSLVEQLKLLEADPTVGPWVQYAKQAQSLMGAYQKAMEGQMVRPGTLVGTQNIQQFLEQFSDPTLSKEALLDLQRGQKQFIEALIAHEKKLSQGDAELGALVAGRMGTRRAAFGIEEGEEEEEVVSAPQAAVVPTPETRSLLTRQDAIPFDEVKKAVIEELRIVPPQEKNALNADWNAVFDIKREQAQAIIQQSEADVKKLLTFEKELQKKITDTHSKIIMPALKELEKKCGELSSTAPRGVTEIQSLLKEERDALIKSLAMRPSPLTVATFTSWQAEMPAQVEAQMATFAQKLNTFSQGPRDTFISLIDKELLPHKKQLFETKIKAVSTSANSFVREEELDDGTTKKIFSFPFLQKALQELSEPKASWEQYSDANARLDLLAKQIAAIRSKIQKQEKESLEPFDKKEAGIEKLFQNAGDISFNMPLKCIEKELQEKFKFEIEPFEDPDDFIAWVDEAKVLTVAADTFEGFDKVIEANKKLLDHLETGPFRLISDFRALVGEYQGLQRDREKIVADLRQKQREVESNIALGLQFVENILKAEERFFKIPSLDSTDKLAAYMKEASEEVIASCKDFHDTLRHFLENPTQFDVAKLKSLFERRDKNLEMLTLLNFSKCLTTQFPKAREKIVKEIERACERQDKWTKKLADSWKPIKNSSDSLFGDEYEQFVNQVNALDAKLSGLLQSEGAWDKKAYEALIPDLNNALTLCKAGGSELEDCLNKLKIFESNYLGAKPD